MNFPKRMAALVAFSTFCLLQPLAQAQATLGSNLIVNGNAESGPGGDGNTIVIAPGFSSVGNFTVALYGSPGGFPLVSSPGPLDRGMNFFAGGPGNSMSSVTQSINVGNLAGLIDANVVEFDLSAYLGGYLWQSDNAVLTASFLSSAASILGSSSIGPVSNGDRGDITGLLLREAEGSVPVGTRSILIDLTMRRVAGDYNDGYADNLSLVLSAVPESSPMTLLLCGLGAVVLVKRLRKDA